MNWNKPHSAQVWDQYTGTEATVNMTDKEIINKPNLLRLDQLVPALCRIVSELVEEEERRKNDSTDDDGSILFGKD